MQRRTQALILGIRCAFDRRLAASLSNLGLSKDRLITLVGFAVFIMVGVLGMVYLAMRTANCLGTAQTFVASGMSAGMLWFWDSLKNKKDITKDKNVTSFA